MKYRIHTLHVLQKKAIRICKLEGYLSHTRPIFFNFKTTCLYDMTYNNNMVFMFKVQNNLLRLLCYFKRVCDSRNHNTRNKNNTYKIKYSRTSQKAACISIKGPKLWSQLCPDLKTCRTVYHFKNHYKIMLLQRYEQLE